MTLLKMLVMYVIAVGPRCLIMMGEMLSGPSAFEFFDFLIALSVCVGLMMKGEFDDDKVAFFLIVRSVCLMLFVALVVALGVYC